MTLDDWKNVINELAANNVESVLLRGGEVFLYPQMATAKYMIMLEVLKAVLKKLKKIYY